MIHVEVPAESLCWSLLPSCDSEIAAATALPVVNTGDNFCHKSPPWLTFLPSQWSKSLSEDVLVLQCGLFSPFEED